MTSELILAVIWLWDFSAETSDTVETGCPWCNLSNFLSWNTYTDNTYTV